MKKPKTQRLLKLMSLLSWAVFVGLMIKAGSIVISYAVSIHNPVAAKDLYDGIDLSAYLDQSFVNYTFVVAYRVALFGLQAYVAFLLIKLLSRLNILNPFNSYVVLMLQIISYSILGIWVVTMIYDIHVAILEIVYGIKATYISGDVLFLAGMVFVFAQMFKRGVEIQRENELTV